MSPPWLPPPPPKKKKKKPASKQKGLGKNRNLPLSAHDQIIYGQGFNGYVLARTGKCKSPGTSTTLDPRVEGRRANERAREQREKTDQPGKATGNLQESREGATEKSKGRKAK